MPAQDESGQRLSGAVPGRGLRGADPAGLSDGGVRRGGGRRLPGAALGDRRDPPHRLRPDVRPDGLGAAGPRAGRAEGRARPADREARERRARQRVPGAGGARALQRPGTGVPGGEHRGSGGDERFIPVQLSQDAHPAEGLERSRRLHDRTRASLCSGAGAPSVLPGR